MFAFLSTGTELRRFGKGTLPKIALVVLTFIPLIYGALYTIALFQGLFLQNTVGYSATAAGIIGLPTGIILTLFSARVGAAAGRIGMRPFLVIGPVVMALGLFWFARIPVTTEPWTLQPADPTTWLPPVSVLIDVLPYILLFGIGITLVVAPLTTTLMTSVPVSNAGLASAINNAISRVGQPLVWALLFIAMTATFYPTLGELVPGLDVNDPALRDAVQPLASVHGDVPAEVASAARDASIASFRLAMIVSAGLLVIGAAISAIGLRPSAGRREKA